MKIPDAIRTIFPGRSRSRPAARGPDGAPAAEPGKELSVPVSGEAGTSRAPFAGQADGPRTEPAGRVEKEITEQVRIAALWKNHWRQYVVEEFRFRLRYGKSCRCDVCGEYKKELFASRGKTCCATHMPAEWWLQDPKGKGGRPGARDRSARK